MNKKNLNLGYYSLFLGVAIIAALLLINRYSYNFIPYGNWRVLLDHLVAGFLVPLILFIVYLGIGSFFHPKRKVIYSINWFLILTSLALLMPIIWDGIIQKFKDIDQIIFELIGIILSWSYFLSFRKIKLEENKPKKELSQQ